MTSVAAEAAIEIEIETPSPMLINLGQGSNRAVSRRPPLRL